MRELILGPPGTGKTTTLLNIVNDYLEGGTPPQDITFVTFTKSGSQEAKSRAVARFNLPANRFSYFRTLHSLCFHLSGAKGVMGWPEYRELSDILGYSVTPPSDPKMPPTEGMIIRHIEEQARTRCISVEAATALLNPDLNVFQVRHYSETLLAYKAEMGCRDFTDLLHDVATTSAYQGHGGEVLVVDEAQDLTELQWRVVDALSPNFNDVYFAGDDDQTIHVWAGACIDRFLALGERCDKTTVLKKSYRLPKTIHKYVTGLSDRIQRRYRKHWVSREDEGFLAYTSPNALGSLPLDSGDWMMLCRNRAGYSLFTDYLEAQGRLYKLEGQVVHDDLFRAERTWRGLQRGEAFPKREVSNLFKKLGLPAFRGPSGPRYTKDALVAHHNLPKHDDPWYTAFVGVPLETRSYLQRCLKNGEHPSRCIIDIRTIHSSKGMEATNVALSSDVSRACVDELFEDPDSEHRVFYVGASRAKERLFLITESGENFYDL